MISPFSAKQQRHSPTYSVSTEPGTFREYFEAHDIRAHDTASSIDVDLSSFFSSRETLANLDHLLATSSLMEDDSSKEEHVLSGLVSSLAVSVLRDAIEALEIVHLTSQLPPGNVRLAWLGSKTLAEMLEGGDFDDRIQTEARDRLEIDKEKLDDDRALMQIILMHTVAKLEENNDQHDFAGLIKIIENLMRKREEEEALLGTVMYDDKKMRMLRKKKKTDRQKYEQRIANIVQSIGRLKDEVMDTKFENETKIKYLDKWENARNEQNQILLDTKETQLQKVIDETEVETINEKLVHCEIMDFLKETIKDDQEAIEIWMTKYDADIDKKEIDRQAMKAKLDSQHEELEKLQKTLKARQVEIDEYLVVRERKRQERAELYKRSRAATKIQSWWRGVMFRKGLGPFKKKKKGKKGDKANKKGNNGGKKK